MSGQTNQDDSGVVQHEGKEEQGKKRLCVLRMCGFGHLSQAIMAFLASIKIIVFCADVAHPTCED